MAKRLVILYNNTPLSFTTFTHFTCSFRPSRDSVDSRQLLRAPDALPLNRCQPVPGAEVGSPRCVRVQPTKTPKFESKATTRRTKKGLPPPLPEPTHTTNRATHTHDIHTAI